MRQAERRRSPRTVVEKVLTIQLEPDNHAIVLNFSDDGLGFHAFNAVVGNGPIQFSFSLPNHERIQTTGEVVWRDGTKKTGGLRFASLPAATRAEIRNWALQAAPTDSSHASTEPASPVAAGGPRGYEANTQAVPRRFPGPMSLFEPEAPRPLLLNDIPADYQAEVLAESRGRLRFFGGFAIGALVAVLAMAAALFGYGPQINDAVAQLRIRVGAKLENAQMASTPSVPSVPVPSADPAAAPPPAAFPAGSLDSSESARNAKDAAAASAASDRLPDLAEAAPPDVPKPADPYLRRAPMPVSSVASEPATRDGRLAIRAEGDTGDKELAIAQGYLRNRQASANGAAVAFLWSAVEKGNVAAELKLAELYAHGEGVTRSCDQARVLLDAAASKGSGEADQQLAQIARERCN